MCLTFPFQFILLSVIAFAIATPIDDKTALKGSSQINPDISKLPLKKDEPAKDNVKVLPSQDGGVHAHPLHKRANDPPKVADQSTGAKNPSNVHNSQQSNSQHQRQPSNAPQNPSPNAPKQQPQAASKPVATSPLTSGSAAIPARVKRDAPKVADVKTGAPAPVIKSNNPAAPSSVPSSNNNNNQKPLYNQQRKPSNAQAAQPSGQRQQVPRPVSSNNGQKSQPAQSNPAVATAPKPATPTNAQPILSQNSRVKRDAPRVADSKTSVPQAASAQGQKSQPIPTNQKPVQQIPKVNTQQKAQVPAKAQAPAPAQGSRVTRESPKPVDAKTSPVNQKAQPVVAQKTPSQIAKTPVTNSRPVRDAPNPHEQSKIVPSAYQPAKSNPDQKAVEVKSSDKKDDKKDDASSLNPSLASRKPSNGPVLQQKRESPPTNIRDSSSSSSSDNQSPTFVHPVPVSQILKKSENGPADASV